MWPLNALLSIVFQLMLKNAGQISLNDKCSALSTGAHVQMPADRSQRILTTFLRAISMTSRADSFELFADAQSVRGAGTVQMRMPPSVVQRGKRSLTCVKPRRRSSLRARPMIIYV